MHSVRVLSQLLVSGLFIAVPTNTENFNTHPIITLGLTVILEYLTSVHFLLEWFIRICIHMTDLHLSELFYAQIKEMDSGVFTV